VGRLSNTKGNKEDSMKSLYTVRWVSRPIFGPIESGTTLAFTTFEEASRVASEVDRGGRDSVVVCSKCGVLDLGHESEWGYHAKLDQGRAA